MNRMTLIGLFLICLLLLAACSASNTESGKVSLALEQTATMPPANTPTSESPLGTATMTGGAMVNLTEEENGEDVALTVNDTLQIQLDGNPTTGFIWEPENLDISFLEEIGAPVFVSRSNLMGASGQFTLTFKALRSGTVNLRLIYHRPFEKNVPPQQVFEVTVNIQN
jgi:inhibitor of cysteine peptidase